MSPETAEPGPDEAYCSSCGEIIQAAAEICPECGVRQKEAEPTGGGGGGGAADSTRVRKLKETARTDKSTAMILSVLITPVGYIMVDEWGWAAVNFFTLNYFLLGWLIVPFHVKGMIEDARDQLEAQGESW